MVRLSVIIPAYNASSTIERCVLSCLHQRLESDEEEIIVIDDGSKDNTLGILNSLSQRFTNVIVGHQENQGQSVARNKALDIASGRYVCFVDSDDYLIDNTLLDVLQTAEMTRADICSYLINVQKKDKNWYYKPVTEFQTNKVYTGEYVMLHKNQAGSCCCSLFRKDFLNSNNLIFYPGIVHQDVEFTTRAHALAERIVFTNRLVYAYEYNSNSTTRDKNYKKVKKSLFDNAIISRNIKQFANKNTKISKQLRSFLIKTSNSNFISTFLGLYLNKDQQVREFLKDYMLLGKELGLLPIHGRTLSWRTSMLIPVINVIYQIKK